MLQHDEQPSEQIQRSVRSTGNGPSYARNLFLTQIVQLRLNKETSRMNIMEIVYAQN